MTVTCDFATVSVLHGNGDGTFGARVDSATGLDPCCGGDRGPQRRTEARPGGGELQLQHGLGAARQRRRDLRAKTDFATGSYPARWRSADLNGDGGPTWRSRTTPPTRSRCCSATATGPSGPRPTSRPGPIPLRGDRGPERRRAARPGDGELRLRTRSRCCSATATAPSAPRPTSAPGSSPTPWRSGT